MTWRRVIPSVELVTSLTRLSGFPWYMHLEKRMKPERSPCELRLNRYAYFCTPSFQIESDSIFFRRNPRVKSSCECSEEDAPPSRQAGTRSCQIDGPCGRPLQGSTHHQRHPAARCPLRLKNASRIGASGTETLDDNRHRIHNHGFSTCHCRISRHTSPDLDPLVRQTPEHQKSGTPTSTKQTRRLVTRGEQTNAAGTGTRAPPETIDFERCMPRQ